jgi:hypothetical protein
MHVPSSAPNLPVGSGALASERQRLTRSTSAPFRARHLPVSGRLCGAARGGRGHRAPVSRRLSAHRHSLLGPSCARRGVGPPSRSACRADARTPTGLSRSARPRPGRGGRSLHPGAAVFPRLAPSHQPPPAASQRPALPPAAHPISGGIDIGASAGVRVCSPVRPSPCLWLPDGAGALGRFP